MKSRNIQIIGTSFILIAICLGAFGAHALKSILIPSQLNSFEVGVRYQIYQGLALLILSIINNSTPINTWVIRLITIGTILFSGSIYCLSTFPAILDIQAKFLGPITPIGGTLLIVAWILFLIQKIKE